jgi:hypothetical protein
MERRRRNVLRKGERRNGNDKRKEEKRKDNWKIGDGMDM